MSGFSGQCVPSGCASFRLLRTKTSLTAEAAQNRWRVRSSIPSKEKLYSSEIPARKAQSFRSATMGGTPAARLAGT